MMEDLKKRTRDFALRIIRLYAALPKTTVARVIGDQLLRSGTAVGANFREALRARSPAEYSTKLGIALMELEESAYWMELLEYATVIPAARLVNLRKEAGELTAIFVTLIKKSKAAR